MATRKGHSYALDGTCFDCGKPNWGRDDDEGCVHPAAPDDTADKVNPDHYKLLRPEPIDVIEGWGLGYALGQVVKYVSRAGRKPGESELDDLRKAAFYLNREIERLRRDR